MAEPVAQHYDAPWGYRKLDAERYERRRCGSLGRGLNLRLLKRALTRALARDPAAGLVLDAPCGTGVLSTFLRRKGYGVIGPDISPTMLERTAKCNRLLVIAEELGSRARYQSPLRSRARRREGPTCIARAGGSTSGCRHDHSPVR